MDGSELGLAGGGEGVDVTICSPSTHSSLGVRSWENRKLFPDSGQNLHIQFRQNYGIFEQEFKKIEFFA